MTRIVFILILFSHGLIHSLGILQAFGLTPPKRLSHPISGFQGIFWLLTLLMFFLTLIAYIFHREYWWALAFTSVIFSQALIFIHWKDAKAGTLANILILAGAITSYGKWQFHRKYYSDVKYNLENNISGPDRNLTENDLEGLPCKVQKYIRYSGSVGKPMVNYFMVTFSGKMRQDESTDWMPFTSEQYNFFNSPVRLFFMNAEMNHLNVRGYHRYMNSSASMDIRMLSLFRIRYQSGHEMDTSETVTFFNDMCCLAPATLVDKRIKWLESDSNRVRASFTANGITIFAWLVFNDTGQLVNFISADRSATDKDNRMNKYPWSTPLQKYKNFHGYNLPGYAEAIYTYPSGDFCYGNFEITGIEYNPVVK
ncbi:MAG: hypothetical protein IT242_07050 [Bacteroidia bacterium]|nr:hypothetical protein [Bacteroidia bacterium]